VAETVVGATTGALAAPKGYFRAMKSVCRKYGALFILDEIMSGMGRESPGWPRGAWLVDRGCRDGHNTCLGELR
jgi:glutamate-1-semialdehyde aminotransferase